MTLLQQLEEITGRTIPVFTWATLAAEFRVSPKDLRTALDRYSRVVLIRDLVAGRIPVPAGPLMILVTDHRDGFLIQLLEGMRKC